MRAVVRLGFVGAVVGAVYGLMIATSIAIGALLTAPFGFDALLAAAGIELYLGAIGALYGGAIGLPYGLATGLIVTVARRLGTRWAPLAAAAAVFTLASSRSPIASRATRRSSSRTNPIATRSSSWPSCARSHRPSPLWSPGVRPARRTEPIRPEAGFLALSCHHGQAGG